MQLATLLYSSRIRPDYAAILARTSQRLDQVVDSSPIHEAGKAFLLFYPQHKIKYAEGEMPAQTVFLEASKPESGNDYKEQVQQSWGFPGAAAAVAEATYALAVTEMMANQLEPLVRLKLFHTALEAAIQFTDPLALVFNHSCQVVDPAKYLAAAAEPPEVRPGALNVRFFNIEGSTDEMVMDTRGLDELGLPDLQCHFLGLDPNDVARVLFNTGVYLMQNGPVIESGQTIAGRRPNEKWKCQYEDSLLAPKRTVLDINPGRQFAAGNR